MEMVTRSMVQAAGDYLMGVLRLLSVTSLGSFEDTRPDRGGAVPALLDALWPPRPGVRSQDQIDLDAGHFEDQDERGDALSCLEYAARQLANGGLVELRDLEGKTVATERDFRIELTERGRDFVAARQPFEFHWPVDLIGVRMACEWLLEHASRDGQAKSWHVLGAAVAAARGEHSVKVLTEEGAGADPESPAYGWAFQAAVWHHSREGHIELKFHTSKQRDAWRSFFSRYTYLFPQSAFRPLLWRVSYRLTGKALDPDEGPWHVRWIRCQLPRRRARTRGLPKRMPPRIDLRVMAAPERAADLSPGTSMDTLWRRPSCGGD